MLPDLESLRCFVAATQHLNFRAAARTVGLSPAAFGERIKRLEDLLEVRLFDRTTRRVAVTPAGARLVAQARIALEAAGACSAVIRADAAPSPFTLTVGTRFELGMSWLTPLLSSLEEHLPHRQLNLFFGDTPSLLHAFTHDDIDCAVTSARITRGGLSFARLHQEHYVFVGCSKLLANKPLRNSSGAKQHTLLEISESLPLFRYFLDARPGQEVWAFDRTQLLGTIGPVRARCLEGAGVAVLPEYFVQKDLKKGRLTRILPSVKMPSDWFRLLWRQGHPREDDLRALATELSGHELR